MKKIINYVLLILLIMGLTGCGFQLRNYANLPYKTIAIQGDIKNLELINLLKYNLQSANQTQIIDELDKAELKIKIIEEQLTKKVLSLSSAGKTREYSFYYTLTYDIYKNNKLILENREIVVRQVPYSDKDILAKEAEEQLLYNEMKRDVVWQLIHKLSLIRL